MSLEPFITICVICIISEIVTYKTVRYVNKKFQWLVIAKDEKPILAEKGLKRFIPHGYDHELGWIRKPKTFDVEKSNGRESKWTINSDGCRTNPQFDELTSQISCYGDSFTFCRQVNDDETWEHYLSKIQNTNVKNFGVGNYGLDQAVLRLKRDYQKNKTKTVIVGIVPDTISRILSSWKHYYEYGNTFAFKPRFILRDGNLELVKNYIDDVEKFKKYTEFLQAIKSTDFFYEQKFKKEILRFPYSLYIFRNPSRNFKIIFWVLTIEFMKKIKMNIQRIEWNPMRIIMRINLRWRVKLYQNNDTVTLLESIVKEYVTFAKENDFVPFLCILPQKDDVNFIKTNFYFYENFIDRIKNIEGLHVIDITEKFLLEKNLDSLYCDNNEYGGHLSPVGNKRVAETISAEINRLN